MTVDRKWRAPQSEFLVSFDGGFRIDAAPTAPSGDIDKGALKTARKDHTLEIYELQRKLYADNRYAVLFVFQAMDAGGKDGTIRNVFTNTSWLNYKRIRYLMPFVLPTASGIAIKSWRRRPSQLKPPL